MIFRSPHPDVAVPDIALHRLVLARAAERGTKPALIDGPSGRILTYAPLTRGADRVAAGLPGGGVHKGRGAGLFRPLHPPVARLLLPTPPPRRGATKPNYLAPQHDALHSRS